MLAAEEYAVLTAACRTDLFNWEAPGTTFADETASDRFTQAPLDHLGGLIRYRCLKYPEMLDDFAAKNARPWPLEKRFELVNGFQLLSERQLSDPDRQGGVFSLSRVGFGRQRELALVYLAYYGGFTCGVGYYLLFERTDREWRLKDRCMSWVS